MVQDKDSSGHRIIVAGKGDDTQSATFNATDAYQTTRVEAPDIQNLDQPDIPKADIHVHIEGTIAPEIARMIADRNGVKLKESLFDSQGNYNWNGFHEFIRSYDDVAFALKNERDYMDVTYHFLKKWASLGCIYSEIIVSPNHADLIGLDRDDMMAGIYAGIDKAKGRFDIDARLNITCLRHESPEMAEEVARYAAGINHPYVTGFNIAGGEREGDIAAYKNAFDIAHNADLRMTAHLAEAASAQQVKTALDLFPYIERIGHGVNMIYDPKILGEARRRGVTLEVCPSSNVEIGVFKSYEEHPFRHLMTLGPKVTINTDDPPFFNTDIQKEYELAATYFGLDDLALIGLTRNAIQAAFCDDDTKEVLLNKVREAEKKNIEQSFPMRRRVPYIFGQSRSKGPRFR
jgi:adenosine deaminase